MFKPCLTAALASALAIHLAACDRKPVAPPVAETSPAPAPVDVVPAPSATPTAVIATPGVPSESRDPAEVLAAWAKSVEARDWVTVRAYWGDHGARSGLSKKAFAAKWSDLLAPTVTVDKGDGEGGAGSLYYTASVTIVDGARTVRGEVVIRRVNDVPGATDEQLRWHIESTTLNW